MLNAQQIKKLMQKIQVVRPPRHRLATFGDSRINYQLITEVPGLDDRSRLRLGIVTARKPSIITPQSLAEQFQGFGDDSDEYVESLIKHYGKALKGLEYEFRNDMTSSRIELSPPDEFTRKMVSEFDKSDAYNSVLIRGSDKIWELSLMKFIVEETLASFNINLQELQDRGFFETDNRVRKRQKREIEHLFTVAKTDRAAVKTLGAKLKEYGLFERYQDSFFRLLDQ